MLLVALLGFSGEETPAPSSLRREALIIFSRHGIRVPYAPPGGIAEYSKSPTASWFPNASDWGAEGEAYLTEHGAAVIRRMGVYHRQLLVDTGFLPSDGSGLTIYADDDPTGRDVKTASAFFDGLLPGVPVRIEHTASYIPRLFNQGALNSTVCPSPTEAQVLGTIGGDPAAISEANRPAIQRLSDAINCCRPVVCASALLFLEARDAAGCTLVAQPTTAWTGRFYQRHASPHKSPLRTLTWPSCVEPPRAYCACARGLRQPSGVAVSCRRRGVAAMCGLWQLQLLLFPPSPSPRN